MVFHPNINAFEVTAVHAVFDTEDFVAEHVRKTDLGADFEVITGYNAIARPGARRRNKRIAVALAWLAVV